MRSISKLPNEGPQDGRRNAIIGATIDVLLESGLLAARTRDVTNRSGVGTGLLNHYFRWSELRAIAWAAIMETAISEQFDLEIDVEVSIEHYLGSSFSDESRSIWQLWLEALDLAQNDPPIAEALLAAQEQLENSLRLILERGCLEKCWTLPDPAGTATRMIALHDGLAGLLLSSVTPLSPEKATAHFRRAFELECSGK
jgi:AcrR family transcriptional regulator